MILENLLTSSPSDTCPPSISWKNMPWETAFDFLDTPELWYGDELAFLNEILIKNGVNYS